jgi:hypothetical protein
MWISMHQNFSTLAAHLSTPEMGTPSRQLYDVWMKNGLPSSRPTTTTWKKSTLTTSNSAVTTRKIVMNSDGETAKSNA